MDRENAHTVTNASTIFDMACGKFLRSMQFYTTYDQAQEGLRRLEMIRSYTNP